MSLNKVMIIGRLGQDPDLKYTTSGAAVCRLSVATDESYTDNNGQRQERTEWHRVVTFQKQAENCSNYLHKGSLVFVEGSLSTNKWTDQQGQTRYTTEIRAQRVQFLDKRDADAGEQKQVHQHQSNQDDDIPPAFPSEATGMDDVPF